MKDVSVSGKRKEVLREKEDVSKRVRHTSVQVLALQGTNNSLFLMFMVAICHILVDFGMPGNLNETSGVLKSSFQDCEP